MIFQRYAAALLPGVGVLLTALQVMYGDNRFDETERGQLIVLVAGLVLTYVLPLLKKFKWASVLKTGASVLAAIGTLIIPTFFTGFTGNTLLIFLIALVNALATEIGVQMRTDAAALEAQVYSPGVGITDVPYPEDDDEPKHLATAEFTYEPGSGKLPN